MTIDEIFLDVGNVVCPPIDCVFVYDVNLNLFRKSLICQCIKVETTLFIVRL